MVCETDTHAILAAVAVSEIQIQIQIQNILVTQVKPATSVMRGLFLGGRSRQDDSPKGRTAFVWLRATAPLWTVVSVCELLRA